MYHKNVVQFQQNCFFFAFISVFLKYYHVEHLAKLYEEQLRRIVIVQACVRRWLARVHYRRTKMRRAKSAMTVQRYVRGWLTRKRIHQMRSEWEQRQKEEQRRQSIMQRESKNFPNKIKKIGNGIITLFSLFFYSGGLCR